MAKFNLIAIIFLAGIIFSCSSGKKALERGNYYEAVVKAVERLRKNPDNKKSRETLKLAYPLALDYYKTELANVSASNRKFKWGETVKIYETINRMGDEIRRSPGALKVIRNPDRYASKLTEAKKFAAEESYAEGMRLINEFDRNASKDAFYRFKDADRYVPNFKDTRAKMNEAREYATLKVVIEQIPVRGRYSLSADFFQDQVEGFLRTGIRNEFVRFFTPQEADQYRLDDVDQIISLYFDDFVVGQVAYSKETKEYTRDSVVVGEVVVDGAKQDVYGTVSADLTVNRAEVLSQGLLAMRIMDAGSNAVVVSDKFPGSFTWFVEWGSFNGDDRALSRDQLRLCRLQFTPPPSNQDMFIEFTRPIYSQLTSRLQRFYKRY